MGGGLACSSSGSSGPSTVAGVGEHKSADIKASQRGSLAATGGSITIPAGALAADTTVTVDVKDKSGFADAGDIAVNVFDFGPNGTTFLKPVAMTLDLQGVTVPAGKTAKIAYYDGAAWKTLDDSQVVDGKVTASTTHFTPFTILFVGGTQVGGGCGSFSPCGGTKGDTATDTGTECKVTGGKKSSTTNETGTWTTAGSTFTTTKNGSSSGTTISYCVTGNTLVAQQISADGVTIQYTATK